MKVKYKSGDLVRIIVSGHIYSSHHLLFKYFGFKNEKKNDYKSNIPEKEIFIIKKTIHKDELAPNGFFNDGENKYYMVNIKNLDEEVLVGETGIELAKKSFMSLSSLINNDELLIDEFKRLIELITNNK